MFDSYTSCNFNKQRKKTDHRGEWAPCAHKKCCVHLIYVCLSHVMQYSKKIHVIGACGLAAFEKIIRFISFTFDCHPLCNFRKKQVIGEGWPDVLAKKQFEFISLHLTLRHHAIFTKKSQRQMGFLCSQKQVCFHLIYFLTNAPCNFRTQISSLGWVGSLLW